MSGESKFHVGDTVRVIVDTDDFCRNGVVLATWRDELGRAHTVGFNEDLDMGDYHSFDLDLVERRTVTPMIERPEYIAGVRKAREREEARRSTINKRLGDLYAFHSKADEANAAAAKDRANRRIEKYGVNDRRPYSFLPVRRGSKPLLAAQIREGLDLMRKFIDGTYSVEANEEATVNGEETTTDNEH